MNSGEVGEGDGFCVPGSGPDLEIGVGGGAFACIDGPYTKLAHGGALTVCEGFQGIIEMWVSLRLTGFAPDADVEVTRSVSLAEAGRVDEAKAERVRLLQSAPDFDVNVKPYLEKNFWALPDFQDRLLAALQAAGMPSR